MRNYRVPTLEVVGVAGSSGPVEDAAADIGVQK